jgi:hypothetical protein
MVSGEMLIGPGTPCVHCGEGYGQHEEGCPVPKQKEREREIRLTALGKAFREALDEKNDFKLGKLLERK